MQLEAEAREVVLSMQHVVGGSKDAVRIIMAGKKRLELLATRTKLKSAEDRALSLMRRVDYSNINPAMVPVAPRDQPIWDYVRSVVSVTPGLRRPFRSTYFFAVDTVSGGLLGITDIGSDVQSLSLRDKHIGWTRERKYHGGLNSVANLGTCVCAPPFGWLTGGKYMAVAMASTLVADMWRRRYGDVLAGITTTALYGKSSMYNRLKEYDYLGDSYGVGVFHMSEAGFRTLRAFVISNGWRGRAGGFNAGLNGKTDILQKACAMLGVPLDAVSSNQQRGIYFAALGDESLAFLRGEPNEYEPYARDQDAIREWWLSRWYHMRLPKVTYDIGLVDWQRYTVDAQIALCGSRLDSEAPVVQAGEDSAMDRPAPQVVA